MHTPLQLLLMPQATDPALAEHVRGAIERLLERKRVTQAQVGRASGIQSQQINRYVRGHETPGLDNLARILRGAGADWYEWAQAWDEADGKEPARLVRIEPEPPPMPPLLGDQKLRAAAEALRLAAEALSRAVDTPRTRSVHPCRGTVRASYLTGVLNGRGGVVARTCRGGGRGGRCAGPA